MTTTEAIAATYLKATGKTTTLTTGSKYNKIVGLLNMYQRMWAREPGVDWASLYITDYSIGTVAATDAYDIDVSTVRNLSTTEGDTVKIMHSDGDGVTEYDIVAADALKSYYSGQDKANYSGSYCARIGNQLVFNRTFATTDAEFGGDIQIPCYIFPDVISGATGEEVQVDDPDWLVIRCAAEYVRTDLTRQNQYGNLLQEANERMQRMIDDNSAQIDEVYRPWAPNSAIGDDAWSN